MADNNNNSIFLIRIDSVHCHILCNFCVLITMGDNSNTNEESGLQQTSTKRIHYASTCASPSVHTASVTCSKYRRLRASSLKASIFSLLWICVWHKYSSMCYNNNIQIGQFKKVTNYIACHHVWILLFIELHAPSSFGLNGLLLRPLLYNKNVHGSEH